MSLFQGCPLIGVPLYSSLYVCTYCNYCVFFTGAVFHYAYISAGIFWCTHIAGVLWGMMFPFHARGLQKKGHFKYLHIGMVVVAIVLPAIPAAVVIATGGSAAPFSPPFICVAKNIDVLFYTTALPSFLLIGIGISLIVIMFLVLVRRTKSPQQKEVVEEKVITLMLSDHD